MWFHVSRSDLGPNIVLNPRTPKLINSSECPKTPRISFSPSIEQCFIGIVGYGLDSREATLLEAWTKAGRDHYTIYGTDDANLVDPTVVGHDYHITGEKWALVPTLVNRLGYPDYRTFEVFKQFGLLSEPLILTAEENNRRFEQLSPELKHLQERWYDHDEFPEELVR